MSNLTLKDSISEGCSEILDMDFDALSESLSKIDLSDVIRNKEFEFSQKSDLTYDFSNYTHTSGDILKNLNEKLSNAKSDKEKEKIRRSIDAVTKNANDIDANNKSKLNEEVSKNKAQRSGKTGIERDKYTQDIISNTADYDKAKDKYTNNVTSHAYERDKTVDELTAYDDKYQPELDRLNLEKADLAKRSEELKNQKVVKKASQILDNENLTDNGTAEKVAQYTEGLDEELKNLSKQRSANTKSIKKITQGREDLEGKVQSLDQKIRADQDEFDVTDTITKKDRISNKDIKKYNKEREYIHDSIKNPGNESKKLDKMSDEEKKEYYRKKKEYYRNKFGLKDGQSVNDPSYDSKREAIMRNAESESRKKFDNEIEIPKEEKKEVVTPKEEKKEVVTPDNKPEEKKESTTPKPWDIKSFLENNKKDKYNPYEADEDTSTSIKAIMNNSRAQSYLSRLQNKMDKGKWGDEAFKNRLAEIEKSKGGKLTEEEVKAATDDWNKRKHGAYEKEISRLSPIMSDAMDSDTIWGKMRANHLLKRAISGKGINKGHGSGFLDAFAAARERSYKKRHPYSSNGLGLGGMLNLANLFGFSEHEESDQKLISMDFPNFDPEDLQEILNTDYDALVKVENSTGNTDEILMTNFETTPQSDLKFISTSMNNFSEDINKSNKLGSLDDTFDGNLFAF